MATENMFNSEACKITPKRKALRDLSNGDSPVSPMANLKLLIKVAANQKSYAESQSDSLSFEEELHRPDSPSFEEMQHSSKSFGAGYVRKNKSLGFLCEKFLAMFPLEISKGESMLISLNNLARELGVEKRRIYDIINIVESLAMAEKVSKDTYRWYGNQNLAETMGLFAEYAQHIGLDNIMRKAQEGHSLNRGVYKDLFEEKLISFITSETKCLLDNRRLGVLCQKFVMLVLSSHQQNSLVSLNAAVSLLVAETELIKTRQRRLYDIANILQSLNIIRRVIPSSSRAPILRKPVFAYSGPKIEKVSLSLQCTSENCQTVANHSNNSIEYKSEFSATSDSDSFDIEKESSPKKPAAKKRLIFQSELRKIPSNNVIHKSFDLFCQTHRKEKAAAASLEPGACYKAVQLGSCVHLIKLQ